MLWPVMRNAVLLIGIATVVAVAMRDNSTLFDGRAPDAQRSGAAALAVSYASEEISFSANANGHFIVAGAANGTTLRFLVDTGASRIALSPAHAERIGVATEDLSFESVYQTAKGQVRGAEIVLDEVRIGPILLRDVAATVLETPIAMPLLGNSFLRRLESYEVRGNRLILRQ
jgi:aspartyl protease family protein